MNTRPSNLSQSMSSQHKTILQHFHNSSLIFQKTADLTYTNEVPTSVYNPSGMYGLKAMGVSCKLNRNNFSLEILLRWPSCQAHSWVNNGTCVTMTATSTETFVLWRTDFISRDMRKYSIRLKSIIALHIYILLRRVKASEILIADQTFQPSSIAECQVAEWLSLSLSPWPLMLIRASFTKLSHRSNWFNLSDTLFVLRSFSLLFLYLKTNSFCWNCLTV